MAIKFKSLTMVLALGMVATVQASEVEYSKEKYFTIKSRQINEIKKGFLGQDFEESLSYESLSEVVSPAQIPSLDPIEQTGKVISFAKDLVALGEDIYKLVIKGKPTNQTTYAPISVVPKINGVAVDVLETESWKAPVKRTYEIIYENLYGMDVVTFRYSVIYSYGGSYEGKGAYLTGIQIIPESVRTLFGYDFTATMKLGGIQNQGTRVSPIAGATLLMEYTVSTVMVAQNQVDTFFITGAGDFKSY